RGREQARGRLRDRTGQPSPALAPIPRRRWRVLPPVGVRILRAADRLCFVPFLTVHGVSLRFFDVGGIRVPYCRTVVLPEAAPDAERQTGGPARPRASPPASSVRKT